MVLLLTLAILAPFFFWYLFNHRSSRPTRLPLPPGPPTVPIIGNILTIPTKGAWTYFSELHPIHGDILFFRGLGNNVLVLNDLSIINDLLDEQGELYSHRPVLTVVGELMGLNRSMPLLPYGREWRSQRRLAHAALNPTAVRKYHTLQEDLASRMLLDLIDRPEAFFAHVRLYAERIILAITYGLPVDVADSKYITHAEATMHVIGDAMVPGAFFCDLIPMMKYLPSWVPFQVKAAEGRAMIERMVQKPFDHVKQTIADYTASPSLAHDLLVTMGSEDRTAYEHSVKWATGSMYGAGGETTYATILTFMLAMALNPDKQKLAQAEVDRVVGSDRLPTIADISKMPYVTAVIKETLRWHPSLPLGIARWTEQDNTYQGYRIPKKSVVMPNIWAISQHPHPKYDPKAFMPERFLDPNSGVTDPTTYVFGFGRRVCPGKALAENSLFVAIAGIFAAFNISQIPGEELIPKFGPALVSYPEPFRCEIQPRSESRVLLVQNRVTQCG
ncbi:hypothetical protein GYMLUDRAFT_99986 [Collybiopsis luxurians FD-317 M1]|uniref:Unplaced genomic scaffold GYMLUscaffold_66, whole genome shotgun sequence n=1 Tax=Collybiopsis luxurians FD-317 M1 TaxID=944289 RepID=A0A0D0CI93_9AGAR|nr:hypothetical protein GYMLUDRAFT_99986 [Collybiopsis luxurians FD-317 M1]